MRVRVRRVLAGFLVAAVVAAVGVVVWTSEPIRPNVLLVTLDTTRADHVSAYGYRRPTTPRLEIFAVESQRFESAWAPMATTLPSHTSLFTGVWPLEHGVLANLEHGGRPTLPSDQLGSVVEVFRDAGYQTAAFVSATPLLPGSGIERGFDTFDVPARHVRRARPVTDGALQWLRKARKKPFFLWVHYYDPHGPFEPPEEHAVFAADEESRRWMADREIPESAHRTGGAELVPSEAIDAYDGELHFVDEQLGRVLDQLDHWGLSDSTVVVVAGDHGEGLGQHEVGGHGHVWREQLQVPLLVRVPWREPRSHPQPVSLVDVFPTVLAWMHVRGQEDWLAGVSGRDGHEGATGPLLGISSQRQADLGTPEQVALTMGSWRWVRQGEEVSVYDLREDPFELDDRSDLWPFHAAILAALQHRIAAEQHAHGVALGTGGTVEVPVDERSALEELGYLAPEGDPE